MSDVRVPMQRLGSTPLVVSRLGLGLAALGRPAYITPGRWRDFGADRSVANLERRCHEMLDAAYAAGIRYVDAPRSYGMAENFLGTWLRALNLSTDAITVGFKVGAIPTWDRGASMPGSRGKDLSLDTLRRQIAESRALVGDCLQLYPIHSATLESKVLENVDVQRELLRPRGSGLGIGLTVTGPNQADVIRRALRVSIDGVNPFQVVQATGICSSHQLAPLGRGTGSWLGRDRDALALPAALAQPWVDVVLSGAVTAAQLESNLKAITLKRELTAWPDIAELPTVYWTQRSTLAWQ